MNKKQTKTLECHDKHAKILVDYKMFMWLPYINWKSTHIRINVFPIRFFCFLRLTWEDGKLYVRKNVKQTATFQLFMYFVFILITRIGPKQRSNVKFSKQLPLEFT